MKIYIINWFLNDDFVMTDTESFKSYELAKSHAEVHPPLLDDYDFDIVETELND